MVLSTLWMRTSASDQDADGNFDCENREDDNGDQQCGHDFAPRRSSHVSLLLSIALRDRIALTAGRRSAWCSGLGASLHLASIDKIDRRIEDHLISRLDPGVHF